MSALAVVGGAAIIGIALFGGSDSDTAVPVGDPARESLNISCFAYRDLDANGSYDLGDRPYAALRVDGAGTDAAVTTSSNAGGFANFEMLLGGDNVLVAAAGSFTFEAVPPDGWQLTSGTAARSIDFVELEGSPAGIVSTEQCEPFGLAPVDPLVVMSQSAEARSGFEPLPNTEIVDFDDFTTANTITEIPNGYAGVDWANWVSTHRILYGGPGYVNGNTSGEFVAYNSSGHPATISSDEPFDVVGGYFSVAWPDGELHDITVQAWRGDSLVATDSFRARTSGPLYFDADYRSVTRVEIASAANWQFVLDDLELRTAN